MSVNIYPVIATEYCNDYAVKINGVPVQTNTARVSAQPFNRRWPGHQRQIEQSELINFVSFAIDEPVIMEIKPEFPFEEIGIRPKSLGIKPQITDSGSLTFKLEKPAYFTVEAKGRSGALHVFCDSGSEYKGVCSDEAVLYFGAGEHDVGNIDLKSGQTLFIDEGAVVYACITATDAENIKIIGRGILDNSRNKEVILYEANETNNYAMVCNAKRQHTIQLEYCENIVIDGITIRDSLVYNIRPVGCKNLKISNVKIIGCWRYNSDGIDMHNCEDVVIENCFIRTFDDSICIKGFDFYTTDDPEKSAYEAMHRNGKVYDKVKNVRVSGCTIWNDWGKCLEIGAETKAEEIADIVFENCDVIHVSGSVLDCYNVDYAVVHDVVYRNINVEYDNIIPEMILQSSDDDVYINRNKDYSPHLISVEVKMHNEYSRGSNRRGINRDISFENINLYGRHLPKVFFGGYDEEHKTENVLIKNLYWNNKLITDFSEINLIKGNYTENIQLR